MDFGSLPSDLWLGLSACFTIKWVTILGIQVPIFINIFWCLMGALIGTAIGVLPGVGPVATMALLLPVTYFLTPEGALIMLAGIYYGAQYGGSTTAILVNLPGEASSVVTCLDGYADGAQGRAGPALAIAALGSFFAGCVATMPDRARGAAADEARAAVRARGLLLADGARARVRHRAGAGSLLKAFGMIFLGMLLGLVGTDVNTGNTRFTFGIGDLFDGIGFVIVAMGVFGIAEIISNLTNSERRDLVSSKVVRPDADARRTSRRSIAPILRGTVPRQPARRVAGRRRGARLLLLLHGGEEALARRRRNSATGMIEGVAGPESANNAAAQTSFIPMLTLGIPSNAVMAMMIGGMMIHGIVPGPQVMEQKPGLFWGMIVSMWLGNLMLLVLNLPLIGIWVRMLLVPYRLLAVAILFFCCIGVYSLNNSANEVLIIAFFGVVGYVFMKLECEPAPLLLGLPARADDGGLHAPRHAAVARRPAGVPAAAAVAQRSCRSPPCCCCSSCCPTSARRGKRHSRSELTAAAPPRILRAKHHPGRI